MKLKLTRSQWEQMRAHVAAHVPEESCGLLGGKAGTVLAVFPTGNAEHSPYRYRLDPVEQVRVMLGIEARGWELVGIFHSHPLGGPPGPSETDIEEAYYPEAVYVIWHRNQSAEWEANAFRIADGRASVVDMEIIET